MYNTGTLIGMDDKEIGIFFMRDCPKKLEKYGDLYLLSSLIIRLNKTIRNKELKEYMNNIIRQGSQLLILKNFIDIVDSYRQYYGIENELDIKDGPMSPKKKHFAISLMFDESGIGKLVFKPSGFGLLGKNVESGALTALMLYYWKISIIYGSESTDSVAIKTLDIINSAKKVKISDEAFIPRDILQGYV